MVSRFHAAGHGDGGRCIADGGTTRQRTEQVVIVPSVRDAIGQHTVHRVLRRTGYSIVQPNAPKEA